MLKIISIFIFAVASFIKCEDPLTENGVFVLNQENFDNFINKNDVVLIEFYAPWCGHCKSFAPIYVAAAEKLSKHDPAIQLAKVDATVETALGERFGVNGYPTLKYFKSGQHYDFDADRSLDGIVNFMTYVSGPNWVPPKNHVITLTKENFTEIITNSDYILVEFFAPWCGHCKSLAPEYAKAAKKLSEYSPPLKLAVVDAIAEPDLAREYNVTGYPTLKLFRYGRSQEYNGPRHSDGIVEWMIKNRVDSAQEVSSKSALNNYRNPEKVLVLGLFQSKQDPLFKTFIEACNQVRDDILSVYTFNEGLRKLYDSNAKDNTGSILLLKPEYFVTRYESAYVKYVPDDTADISIEGLVSFFEQNVFTIVGEYNHNTAVAYQRFPKDYLCLFFFTVDFTVLHRDATKMWLDKIVEVAIQYKEKIQFAIADDEKQFEKLKELRLDDSGEDMNVGCITRENVKYRMSSMDEFDKDHIHKFLKDMLQEKIFPLLKSAPIPKSMPGVIKSVVGDTYKKVINDDPSEAVILVYHSPCEACVKLKSFLQRVASHLNEKVFHFLSMDMTLNEFPPIEGFDSSDTEPTIFFIKLKDDHLQRLLKKKLIKFTGDKENENELRSFIINNSEHPKQEL